MKSAVVTGGCGFIGKALIKRLLEQGVQVFAIVSNPQHLEELSCSRLAVIVSQLADYGSLSKHLSNNKIDVFFHLAWDGIVGTRAADSIVQLKNIEYTLITLQMAFEKLHVEQFIFAGSSYEHKIEPLSINGQIAYENTSLYGTAKSACRQLCSSYAASHQYIFKTFSFTNVFGVGDFSNRSTNSLIRQFKQGIEPSLIKGNHLHDWTYIDDAIDGILAVADRGLPFKNYYIGKRNLITFKEIITQVRDILAPEISLHFGTYDDQSYINYQEIDLNALYQDSNFECTSNFEDSILKTAEWVAMIDTK